MEVNIESSWKNVLTREFERSYFKALTNFVKSEYKEQTVYPPANLIFNAFEHCPLPSLKVVILGQDPYHGPGQAHGLSFSVQDGIKKPPSLVNIFKELKSDIGKDIPESGDLTTWADQGILLLNATLTVRARTPGSHQRKGWEEFTDGVIQQVSDLKEGVVFLLWGAYAQRKGEIIDTKKHYVLKAAHPSPYSASNGFFGCKHFSRTNEFLESIGKEKIEW